MCEREQDDEFDRFRMNEKNNDKLCDCNEILNELKSKSGASLEIKLKVMINTKQICATSAPV